MLNHANDNINMNRHLVNVHKRKLTDKGITSYEAWLAQLENPNNAIDFNTLIKKPQTFEGHSEHIIIVILSYIM